eukprot:260015_1
MSISRQLHHGGYASIRTNKLVSQQLQLYQHKIANYLSAYTSVEIQQHLSQTNCMKLMADHKNNNYMNGKLQMVYKPKGIKDTHHQQTHSIVTDTHNIFMLLRSVSQAVYDEICYGLPQLQKYSASNSKSSSYQDENSFFADNDVHSLTIYKYMGLPQYEVECAQNNTKMITNKSCTAHVDLDLLTFILISPEVEGLEVVSAEKEGRIIWKPIQYPEFKGADLFLFGGALLQTLSERHYAAVVHRVQRLLQSRISIVFKLKGSPHQIVNAPNTDAKPHTVTQVPFTNIQQREGVAVKQFIDSFGPWYSVQRQHALDPYLDSDEIDAMHQQRLWFPEY